MNNLAYNSQDPAVVGARVEEKVREELGGGAPLAYRVAPGEYAPAPLGSALRSVGAYVAGGKEESLFRLNFDLRHPRRVELLVNVNRQGIGSYVGRVLYTAPLSRPVPGDIVLENPRLLGKSKFTGDAVVCAKLNASGEILRRANSLARTESETGGLKMTIQRCCAIVPRKTGSMLVLGTLPRTINMGFGASLDAKEFFDLATMIEATL